MCAWLNSSASTRRQARVWIQTKRGKNRLEEGKPADDFQRKAGSPGTLRDHRAGGFRHERVTRNSIDHALRPLPQFQDFVNNGRINVFERVAVIVQIIKRMDFDGSRQTGNRWMLVCSQPDFIKGIESHPRLPV